MTTQDPRHQKSATRPLLCAKQWYPRKAKRHEDPVIGQPPQKTIHLCGS